MSDELLLKRARRGDRQAFSELVAPLRDRLYAICLNTLCVPADAEDAAQETLIKLYLSLPDFSGRSSLYTYAYRIAVNTCMDMLKKRRPTAPMDELLQASSAASPEDELARSELRQDITALLLALPDDQRAVLVLRDVEGFSYEEAAQILGISMGTLKSRLFRARDAFRRLAAEAGLLE